MKAALTIEDDEFAMAADEERRVRHDVMVIIKFIVAVFTDSAKELQIGPCPYFFPKSSCRYG
jgi:hypothetical protein